MVRSDRFFGVTAALAIKAPCRAVTTIGDHPLSGLADVEGISITENDRVLVTAQLDPVQNGIYNASSSAWQRSADFDGQRDVTKGTIVSVNVPIGTITSYVVDSGIAGQAIAIDTDAVTFSVFFAQTSSIDDLDDVDTTGCTDDDLMYWSGGVLICTLGALTYDGVELLSDGNIGIKGFNNGGPTLRAREALDLISTLNPRRNDQYTGIGGEFGNLDLLHDNNATSSFLGLRLKKFNDLRSQRIWNVEGIAASTTQTQGQAPVGASLVRVTAVANPDDVITLSTPELGLDQMILNQGVNRLQIFPPSGVDLGLGVDTPTTIAAGGAIWFVGLSSTLWHTMSIAQGAAGGPLAPIRGTKAVKTGFIAWPRNDLPDFLIPSITGATEQILDFNSTVYDTEANAIHDTGVNPTRWHMPVGFTQFEMIIGYKLDSLGVAQAGLGHVRLRRNDITNGAVDTVQVGSWEPWNSDNNAGGTNQSGGATGEAGMQHWYSGLVNMNAGDYVEVLILTQAGQRDTPANGFWAEFRLLG